MLQFCRKFCHRFSLLLTTLKKFHFKIKDASEIRNSIVIKIRNIPILFDGDFFQNGYFWNTENIKTYFTMMSQYYKTFFYWTASKKYKLNYSIFINFFFSIYSFVHLRAKLRLFCTKPLNIKELVFLVCVINIDKDLKISDGIK